MSSDPINIEPFVVSVTRAGQPTGTLHTTGPSIDSSLFNKKRTFQYNRHNDPITKLLDTTETINIECKLGDGKTMILNDVLFNPSTGIGTTDRMGMMIAQTPIMTLPKYDHIDPAPRIDEHKEHVGTKWIVSDMIDDNKIIIGYTKGKVEDTRDIFSISEQMKEI